MHYAIVLETFVDAINIITLSAILILSITLHRRLVYAHDRLPASLSSITFRVAIRSFGAYQLYHSIITARGRQGAAPSHHHHLIHYA